MVVALGASSGGDDMAQFCLTGAVPVGLGRAMSGPVPGSVTVDGGLAEVLASGLLNVQAGLLCGTDMARLLSHYQSCVG